MRRPARQPDDVERGADASVAVGKTFGIDLRHAQQRRTAQRRAAALGQHIGRAHSPQILHQREGVVVAHDHAIDVGDRKREAGALQQRAEIAQVRERQHARRQPALELDLRRSKGLPQFGQRVAAEQRGEKQAIRPQRAADLRQHARQIIGKVQRKRREHEVERLRRKLQRFVGGIEHADARDRVEPARLQAAKSIPRRPDIGDVLEVAQHRAAAAPAYPRPRDRAGTSPARGAAARACRARKAPAVDQAGDR